MKSANVQVRVRTSGLVMHQVHDQIPPLIWGVVWGRFNMRRLEDEVRNRVFRSLEHEAG